MTKAAQHSIRRIQFEDVLGQQYNFALDAEDEIFSLMLVPGPRRGVQSLVVNGTTEVYHVRPKGIITIQGND